MDNSPRMGDDVYYSLPSSTNSTPPTTMDEYRSSSQESPFDFASNVGDRAEDGGEGNSDDDDGDDGFDSTVGSISSLNNPPESGTDPSTAGDILRTESDTQHNRSGAGAHNDAARPSPPSAEEVPPPPSSASPSPRVVPHRGSLRRYLDPSSFYRASRMAVPSSHSRGPLEDSQADASSSWPMYVVDVATEAEAEGCSRSSQFPHGDDAQTSLRGRKERPPRDRPPQPCYRVIFDRRQYEFYTRLFALLDAESRSSIGPDCVREFVRTHCPVARRRDDAFFALGRGEGARESVGRERGSLSSPTFEEIWERTVRSDPRHISADTSNPTAYRIGIEGWMVFCRLLSLAHHQESQRRFASSCKMMRHKHGGGSTRDAGVVVVVENPPLGPPSIISMQGLMDVEQERGTGHIPGWPFCPLPLVELDLDHSSVFAFSNSRNLSGMQRSPPRGVVSVEPFSSSVEGDFILRFQSNGFRMVVRRSYADFEWLNAVLKSHKRQGLGHLCGRILPHFPTKRGVFRQQHSFLSKETLRSSGASNQCSQKDISERAIGAAKSGMGMISSMAKNVWSEYVSGSTPSSSPSASLLKNNSGMSKVSSPHRSSLAEGVDLPTMVAHGIERYLNYLLESDALSTSFALTAILRASHSGLESAKQILQDHAYIKKLQRSNLVTDATNGGHHSAASIFSALVAKTPTSLLRLQDDGDTPWLRSAARVAMALQFHGILETTGHESTSAKIQHASLPKFCNRPTASWGDEDSGDDNGAGGNERSRHSGSLECDSPRGETNFEVGVINVGSELADEENLGGYDMLPLPGPSEEHRVLNAGSVVRGEVTSLRSQPSRSRFVYEASPEQSGEIYDRKDSVLGSIRVENDIDKLGDIIRSINLTLGKLHQSSVLFRSAQDARNTIMLSLLRGADSWGDSGGEVISQRALVEGVATLESVSSVTEESNSTLTDDLLWQASLATSAVTSVTEVRDAVRASHTASRAKMAAFAAAEKAKKVYESCDHSSSKEKIQHTQAEASTTQSHAIHATVVEYEANIAKKRSAVSLAQDVKSWNIHRKRELLRTCVQSAKLQQEACRKAADAWESLRDGLINSSGCTYAKDKDDDNMWTHPSNISQVSMVPAAVTSSFVDAQEILASEVLTTSHISDCEDTAQNLLSSKDLDITSSLNDWENTQQDFSECVTKASSSVSSFVKGFSECDVEAPDSVSSTIENSNEILSSKESQQFHQSEIQRSSDDVYCISPPDISHLVEDYFSLHQDMRSETDPESDGNGGYNTPSICESVQSGNKSKGLPKEDTMSMSMQSLIDGLMTWENNEGSVMRSDDDQLNSLLE